MGRLTSEIGKLFGEICEKYKSVSFHWYSLINNTFYSLLLLLISCDILITIMFEDLSPVLDGLMTKEHW